MEKLKSTSISESFKRIPTSKCILNILLTTCLLSGCQTLGNQGSSNFDIFKNPSKFVVGEDVVLPRDRKALTQNTGAESTLQLIVELDQQKRFPEARHLISQVRAVQPGDSKSYQFVTNSMAVLALKEGNFRAFKRIARQLDSSLGNPVRVEAPHTEIITLYRSVTGKKLPVNAPAHMKMLKKKFPSVQKATLQRRLSK